MTKETGLFDVDFTLTTKELTNSIKGEKTTTAHYKLFSDAVETIINLMQVSGYRPRTKDYVTVLLNFDLTAILSMYKTCIRINTLGQLEVYSPFPQSPQGIQTVSATVAVSTIVYETSSNNN